MPTSVRRGVVLFLIVATLSIGGFVVWMVFLNPAWDQCASRIDGQYVEHNCSEGPPR